MTRSGTLGRNALGCVFACALAVPLLRAEEQRIPQMVRTSWTGRDGAPQAINSLAQTPDGTLWIGSTGGLFSFNGLKFTAFQSKPGEPSLPSNAVRSLMVAKNGDLWVVGAYVGSVARISDGHVALFGKADRETSFRLHGLKQDSKGTLWGILNYHRLVRFGSDSVWHSAATPLAGAGYLPELFIDSQDTQWVVDEGRVYRRSAGENEFSRTSISATGDTAFAEGPEHDLWIWDEDLKQRSVPGVHGRLQHVDRLGCVLGSRLVSERINAMLPMPDHSLWLATNGRRITRLRSAQVDGFAAQARSVLQARNLPEGVPAAEEDAILRDADGNIWVGGGGGLDRFERASLVPAIGGGQVGDWSACTNSRGEVWIASAAGALYVLRSERMIHVAQSDSIQKLFCGDNGDVWFLDGEGIGNVHLGRVRHLPLIRGYGPYGGDWNYITMLQSADHRLIASVGSASGQGLWRLGDHGWERYLPHSAPWFTTAMILDRQSSLYLGHFDGTVSVFDKGELRAIPSQSQSIGVIQAFAETSRGLFALGAKGIAAKCGDGFETLSFARPELALTVTGLVEAQNGDVWINGARGIVQIFAAEFAAGVRDVHHPIIGIPVSEGDFIGPAYFWNPTPSAMRDTRGRLWFSTLNGVVSIDPAHLQRETRLPHLSLGAMMADGHQLDANKSFPPNLRTLDIQYLGIDLTAPQKVVYRYRLDGLDQDWQDVGHRTEAIYTHLKPGTYRFRVMASNRSGQWTTPVASPPFTVLPNLYQTWWFGILCALAALCVVWLAVALRMRYLVREVKMRAEERADERIRIARELHDTLLQGVQGLLLSFHVASQKLPANGDSKAILEKVLARADQVIIEGRNRVNRLRSEHLTDAELFEALERVGADLNDSGSTAYHVERTGNSGTLQPQIVDEVFYLLREALTNAFRHAQATDITVKLAYLRRSFTASCTDDGTGFEPETQEASHNGSHWGLKGMAERAEKIGGRLSIRSGAGRGTEVRMTVPAYRAYVRTNVVGTFLELAFGYFVDRPPK